PSLVIGGDDKQPDAKQPAKDQPKNTDKFPPPPTPMPQVVPGPSLSHSPGPSPSPVYGSLGFGGDGCCGDGCCVDACCTDSCCKMPRLFGHWATCCGDPCCGDRPMFWVNAEYLLWWQRAISVPPLVTSSPGGQLDNVGVLGDPRTTI